jgi:ketosteroid isomerase-like protein
VSSADIAALREMYDAFNRGDYQASFEMLHPDAELHQPADLPGAGKYFGRDEFARGLGHWQSGFEPGFQYQLADVVDAGGCVLMSLVLRGRGRSSGAEVVQRSFNVWEVRDGKPFRCRIFSQEAEARKTAGLE